MAMSPFVKYLNEIQGGYSTANRLQDLVLHLYNDEDWPVHLGVLLANADERHKQIVLELIDWYWQHGENDEDFMILARNLAKSRERFSQ